MNKNIVPITALLTAATILTAACGTPHTEPVAAPSSSAAAPSSGSAVQEYRKAKSEEAKREMRLHVEAGIPHDVDRRYAEAAAADQVPFAFTYGSCALVRLPDKTLWSLNGAGGPLTRDVAAEKAFGSWPGAGSGEGRPCSPAVDIPAADAPSASGPYRWIGERGFQRLRVNGAVYALPAEVPESGVALRDAVDHGPAPTSGEVVPGVPSTYPN
ncbi:hypothetical protein [Mycolicibacterium fortuitum]|uniref:hypothetical protein n=1 Tax=Mycolicibacterium fortuitum TaxID=1766 RepID=UPI002627CC8A|nr:hypothetical protein [Mycolicibacterium fortuitum]